MEGADESTELWRHPIAYSCAYQFNTAFYCLTYFGIAILSPVLPSFDCVTF